MSLFNVTTWSARKRHLADTNSGVARRYGPGLDYRTLCNEHAVMGGEACAIGTMTTSRIDAMAPCKRCEKRRGAAEAVQP